MRNDYFDDFYKIESYCKSEGLNTEYFIVANKKRAKHTNEKGASGWLTKGR